MGTALDIKIKRANKVYRCGVSAGPGPARQPPPVLRAPGSAWRPSARPGLWLSAGTCTAVPACREAAGRFLGRRSNWPSAVSPAGVTAPRFAPLLAAVVGLRRRGWRAAAARRAGGQLRLCPCSGLSLSTTSPSPPAEDAAGSRWPPLPKPLGFRPASCPSLSPSQREYR